VMQMAVNALKLDSGHYNMLDRKNKQWELKNLLELLWIFLIQAVSGLPNYRQAK
jgi:hypothetical protein